MSFIYDWFKQFISPATVAKGLQSDSPTTQNLAREFAMHPSRGLTPAKLAAIFLHAEQGYLIDQANLFMDMEEKDAHIGAEMGKRKMAVKQLDWHLAAPRDATATERKHTRLLENLLRDGLDMGEIRFDLLDAVGHGYSCTEIAWAKNGQGWWMPEQLAHRPPSWFMVPPDAKDVLHLRDCSQPYGVPLTPFGWLVHLHRSRAGYIARTGLHRALAWPYLFKNYSVRDLAEFLEIYGLPIRIGKYPAGTPDDQKMALMQAVLSIGHHAAGIVPDTMQLELSQVTGTGSAESFKVMMDWADDAISKAILGGTLTSSTAKNGNRALGEVHNDVRLGIRDDDARQLDNTLGVQLVYPVALLNGLFADTRCPAFVSDTQEPEDLKLYAESLPALANAGLPIPISFVSQKLKIPLPVNDEPVLTASQVGAVGGGGDGALRAQWALLMGDKAGGKPSAAVNADGDVSFDPTPVAAETDILAAEAGPSVKALLAEIYGWLDEAEHLEAFRDKLLNGYGGLDSDALTRVMGLAFSVADLAGRFDVQGGG